MKIKKGSVFSLFLSISIAFQSFGQDGDKIDHVVYLIGNTATREINEAHLTNFQHFLATEDHSFSVIHLGDILNPDLRENTSSDLDLFFKLVDGQENGKICYIPGDKDWDNSREDGLKTVRELEKRIEGLQNGENIFLPSDGCPGPEVIDLSPDLRLIVINTQWWLHPFDKPEAPDSDCKILTREEFIESLDEVIEESEGKNILLAGHHPVVSAGVYGGHMNIQKHLFPLADMNPKNRIPIPVLGSFYASFRQNVGTVRDMAYPDYQDFIGHMNDLLNLHPGMVYVSAHDYSLQLLEKENGYQVISGSINEKEPTGNETGAIFTSSVYGFSRLNYYKNGTVTIGFYELSDDGAREIHLQTLFQSACLDEVSNDIPLNRYYIPCIGEDPVTAVQGVPFPDHNVTVTGGDYPARGVKKVLLGSLYRTTWNEPVSIPYLNLDTTKTGLTPFALGGGRQTTTLKFRANNGFEYAFRSVDKNLVNALPSYMRNTFIGVMIKEVTATEYPYGAIAVSSLLDATDILHARPELYVLPDHPKLGAFQSYAGLFGMLEDRPKDPQGDIPGFMGADDVTRSAGLFRKLYEDNDRRVDAYELGKARVFDMLIGDWGRHEDNWKWAGYDVGDKRIYYPIPRDRDHAFSRWNGVLPFIADREWAMPMVESFDYDFNDIRSLTWPGRHVDRLLVTSLDREDWKSISNYIQQTITEDVIDRAVTSLPVEIQSISGIEIGEMLKSRRKQLPEAVDEYYMLLAEYVDVVGSNKHEFFNIERLESGNVRVSMFKQSKEAEILSDEPLFEREFISGETREIHLYGLDGSDIFRVSGSADNSILVRIIGGPGDDSILDNSNVKGAKKHTLVYDNTDTDLSLSKESKDNTSEETDVNQYDRKAFAYNSYMPKPLIYYSGDDGLVASFGISWTTQGFRKPDYKSKHDLYIRGGTIGNVQLGIENSWNDFLGKWDLGMNADYGHYYPYYNFFDFGNNTRKDKSAFDADYYKVRVKGFNTELFSEVNFIRKGIFRVGLLFEQSESDLDPGSIIFNLGTYLPGIDRSLFAGVNTRIYLDLRDRTVFATRGFQLLLENTSYTTIEGASDNFGMAESYLKYYASKKILLPATLVAKVGGTRNYGEDIPYFKYTYLGQFNNLRGFRRNRFTGDAAAYLNTDLRLHFGEITKRFIPIRAGLIGFYDMGKVWYDGNSDGGWHQGYGGGFYLAPLVQEYAFSILLESSAEEKLLFRFGMGFVLDQ